MNKFLNELMTLATELNKAEGFNALTVINDMELLYERHVAELKNLAIHDVSNRRELLIAFVDWYKTTDFNCEGCCSADCADEYLKSN